MKWVSVIAVALLGLGAIWFLRPTASTDGARPSPVRNVTTTAPAPAQSRAEEPRAARPPASSPIQPLTTAEKAARVARIRADYEAMRKGVAEELAAVNAAGAAGPGPFTETRVFLRRLVLLQREERADLAQVLDAAELEEIDWRESPAGQLVAQRLGGTAATEAQRRAVFRLEREFDERFGFVFDLAKEALAGREHVRKETDEKIRTVLGEELFQTWSERAGR